MQQLQHAVFEVRWLRGGTERIPVLYNPTEISFEKAAQIAEIGIPGLDTPLLQFVRGQNERLTLELFFDTTSEGMGKGAQSVTRHTDRIYQLVKIEPERHAPPRCTFIWNSKFPGANLDRPMGNQRRNHFHCVVESVRQKFTLFSPEGVPLRATLTVTLREFKELHRQLVQLNLQSPDRTQSHVVEQGETLAAIAARHYGYPDAWRRIAAANGLDDPRRLAPGTFLELPPLP